MKSIALKEPPNTYFCMAVPAPENKIDITEKKEEVQFHDPETKKPWKAVRETLTWYPQKFMSDFVCKISMQMTPNEVVADVMRKYKDRMKPDQDIAIVQFKKI